MTDEHKKKLSYDKNTSIDCTSHLLSFSVIGFQDIPGSITESWIWQGTSYSTKNYVSVKFPSALSHFPACFKTTLSYYCCLCCNESSVSVPAQTSALLLWHEVGAWVDAVPADDWGSGGRASSDGVLFNQLWLYNQQQNIAASQAWRLGCTPLSNSTGYNLLSICHRSLEQK